MITFFLAMALHPDIMRKAQYELDAVTGRDRLPTFEDRPRLPFVDAVCKEVSRWRPVIPLGMPTSEYFGRDIWNSPSQQSLTQLQRMTFTKGS
jgi:cytochrome P450